ncbi:uncharacterized protein LOC142335340 [Convolutriloba macropyga]|uniref:uncharacterized protein LOC142335340 n=1 Tax=Convolutriloba macropyga TaxID=536237 RepID=UPI003F5249D3
MTGAENESTFSIFRSVIIKMEEVKVEENAFVQSYNEVLTVNVAIKVLKPALCSSENSSLWEEVLEIFCRLNHEDLAKLVLKYVTLNQTAIDHLNEIPLLFDLTSRDVKEVEEIMRSLRLTCSTKKSLNDKTNALPQFERSKTIVWDPDDLPKSIDNLPNPGMWSQRTSSTTIHVVGACASWIHAPEGYEIFHPTIDADVHLPYRVIYYADAFFESTFFPSTGDIILLYPGNYYCGWQVRSTFVVPSVEVYGVNAGIHELDVVGAPHYSEMVSDGGLLDVSSSFYQPYPIYNIFGNLTVRSRLDGRPVTVRGGEVHLFLFNCCIKTAHYPAVLFSPSAKGSLHMRRCFVSGAMDSCLVLGKGNNIGSVEKIEVSLKECKITKSGRGYLSKSGHSPAISILTLTSLEIDNCIVRDNVGHAFQMKGPKHRKPQRLLLKGNILKRNQACDSFVKRNPEKVICCKESPASFNMDFAQSSSKNQAATKSDGTLLVRGRYCFACGEPARKICSHCKNAFYCNVQCQMEDWKRHHQSYCVK